jgi:RHS repeat-associated protein
MPQNDANHLNTPRLVADATGTTVWRWDQAEPFGNNPADENPDANSIAFDLPLRLPGQRYDAETGLHYNYFRDYDPSIGRYGESDPIGLRGGLNTYVYVAGRPLNFADLRGLCKCRDASVLNFMGSAHGALGFGVFYGSGDVGVAFDTEGNLCAAFMICGMAPPMGVMVGGAAGVAGSVGTGRLCSGEVPCVGIIRAGGHGIVGEGQALKCGDDLAIGRGLVLAGELWGGGIVGCVLKLVCSSDSECCSKE